MTKRSGDHKLQKERRKAALEYRQKKQDHVPAQVHDRGQWLKVDRDDWSGRMAADA
jgi:hypothetical protein